MGEKTMYLNSIIELTLTIDAEKFDKLLKKLKARGNYERIRSEDKYIDSILASKGLTVIYHDQQYKKKVKLSVNSNLVLDGDQLTRDNARDLVSILVKGIDKYFNYKYKLNDFRISQMILVTDIDVGEQVADYLKVLHKLGRVKGFLPPKHKWLDDEIGFCLEGNSNGVEFLVYDLERQLQTQKYENKKLKSIAKNADGVLRIEARLTKPKAIKRYTDEAFTIGQLTELSARSKKIFKDIITRIIPFGDFHKKDTAVQLIWKNVKDRPTRRRMLRLLDLVPEKKSLHYAQKEMQCRRMDDVMEAFTEIELSPVTISKRHDVKKLRNLYSYL